MLQRTFYPITMLEGEECPILHLCGNSELINGNDIIINKSDVNLVIDYPLSSVVTRHIKVDSNTINMKQIIDRLD